MGRMRRLHATAAVLVASLVPATAAAAQDPAPLPRPDAIQQPLEDGCQRDPVGLLTFHTPEWVFVYADENFNPNPAQARVAVGVAPSADLAAGDLPQNHSFYDFNADLLLDEDYQYLAGGDLGDPDAVPPIPPTGNLAEFGGQPILHIEWESGTLPPFAWPSADDRLKVWGSWVWDCGHWGQGFTADPNDPAGTVIADTDYFLPGTNQTGGLRGEGTEFHPMRAVVAIRESSWRSAVGETQADAFISSRGTMAYSEAVCARLFPPPPSPVGLPPLPYPPAWTACTQNPLSARQNVEDRDYHFFVPAPPKPTPDAELTYRLADKGTQNAPKPQVEVKPDGIRVTVPFADQPNPGGPRIFAKRFFVGWTGTDQYRPALLAVRLKRLVVNDDLENPPDTSAGLPPGEYGLYLDVNGAWYFLNDWAPGLAHVTDGEAFQLNRRVLIRVPEGAGVRLEVDGRECDLPRIQPCPPTSEVADDNDNPGSVEQEFASADDALGIHVLEPSTVNYTLRYEIAELEPARFGGP
jgi:hypothetical protein